MFALESNLEKVVLHQSIKKIKKLDKKYRYNYNRCLQEYLKPVFASGSESEKAAARRSLYTTLEYGLKLLSPFMPFVTEELYQRLPRQDTSCPSICVASYPTVSLFVIKTSLKIGRKLFLTLFFHPL